MTLLPKKIIFWALGLRTPIYLFFFFDGTQFNPYQIVLSFGNKESPNSLLSITIPNSGGASLNGYRQK